MAEQTIEIRYAKSPQWRAITATGAAINSIGSNLAGFEVHMRFTYEWTDMEKETFTADVTTTGTSGTYVVKSAPQYINGPITKVEEVAVRMQLEVAVRFCNALLGQFGQMREALNDQQKQSIRQAFDRLQLA